MTAPPLSPNRRPRNFGDQLLWDVSFAVEQHKGQLTTDGRLVCRDQAYPCPSARLAARGLLAPVPGAKP
jgi:hypothetical protein